MTVRYGFLFGSTKTKISHACGSVYTLQISITCIVALMISKGRGFQGPQSIKKHFTTSRDHTNENSTNSLSQTNSVPFTPIPNFHTSNIDARK